MRNSIFLIAAMICAGGLVVPCSADNGPFWIQESPSTIPVERYGHAMAFDAAHGQVVLFGGHSTFSSLNDTWVWNGVDWTNVTPADNNPPARIGAAMVYDSTHSQVVLFGGSTLTGTRLNDTWVWDGSTWSNVSPATNNPPARFEAAMAYDAAHGQVVLFGGNSPNAVFADTWVWNGNTWSNVTPTTNNPAGRASHAMAYDAAHGEVVLFGGGGATGDLNDTWVWNSTSWTNITPASNNPHVRRGHAMAYDAAHNLIVLFGGESIDGLLNDTWVWNGNRWTLEAASSMPSSRYDIAAAYDARHDQVVLFGGRTTSKPEPPLNDTWVLGHGVFASAGNPQSTPAGNSFSFPLEVTVVDNLGNYVNGAQVVFSGPANMVTFSSLTAATGNDGRAHVTATATASAGSYNVSASVNGTDFALFALSNVNTANPAGACSVTTALDDNSAGSLRSQVATCGKGGTITFATGLSRVIVSQGQDIQFTQDLTIDGGNGVTIDAGSSSRIFFMFGGNITLKNLTLQKGLARGGNGGSGYGGGGGAGMGGAIFVNGGTLSVTNVRFANNQASGGNGGPSGLDVPGGGGGVGGDGGNGGVTTGNGGGGGDFGSSGGTGANGSGGSTNSTAKGGFGGGGTFLDGGGFGGGGGAGNPGGSFGGNSIDPNGGGGAGLGGAIFLRSGSLLLTGATFSLNSANHGLGNGGSAQDGQGKGGAIFIYSGATAAYIGSLPAFTNDSATDAAAGTACSSVVGSGALDTNDVCGVLLAGQTISFSTLSDRVYGSGSFNVTATASSGLAVSFSSLTMSVCTVTSTGSVSLIAGGTCTIQASQAGNATYAAATPVSQSFNVLHAAQTITFGALADQGSGAPPFGVSATASSGLAVSFASTTPGVCSVSGGTVTVLAAGLCSIQASQAGNSNYLAATPVTQSFHVLADASAKVQVTQNGFTRNRATGLWVATMTVTNVGGSAINGPIQVVLTNLSLNATMANPTGFLNGAPYITVSAGALGAGGSTSVTIQFNNPSNGFITFTPVTYSPGS